MVGIFFTCRCIKGMPAHKNTVFMANIHPRGGVTPDTIEKLGKWVGKNRINPFLRYIVATEPNKNDDGDHLHFCYVLTNESDKQTQSRAFHTLFTEELNDGTGDWGVNSIVISSGATMNFYMVAGGYLRKDSMAEVISDYGIDPEEIKKGHEKHTTAKELSQVKRASRATIPSLVAKYYHRMVADGRLQLTEMVDKHHILDYIFRAMIKDGYHHLLFEFTGRNKEAILHFWPEIIQIKTSEEGINALPSSPSNEEETSSQDVQTQSGDQV